MNLLFFDTGKSYSLYSKGPFINTTSQLAGNPSQLIDYTATDTFGELVRSY